MARIIIELTNRCNLRCKHCFDERHAATSDLPLAILDKVLSEGQACGIDHISFTGGEPTIHRQFSEIVRRISAAGYTFSMVSNGINFPQIHSLLLAHRAHFKGVTFSVDGARATTHDRLRGKGAFRRAMRAASICVMRAIPFTFNMVLTKQNQAEIAEMVALAEALGSHAIRFGHLMITPDTAQRGLDLTPAERRAVEAEIWALEETARIAVGIAPGYYSESPFFPCGPLTLSEYNLDYRGNVTLCCHLSGYTGVNAGADLMGNLHEVTLKEACERFHRTVEVYLANKQKRVEQGELTELDHFPCWYCVKYMGKVTPQGPVFDPAWLEGQSRQHLRSLDVHVEAKSQTSS